MTKLVENIERAVTVVGIDGSPTEGGRTRAAIAAVAAGATAAGARVETVALGNGTGLDSALEALGAADAVILGSPVYRAAAASPLKQLLDLVPRTNGDGRDSPLAGKAVSIVHTGASLHHFLALDGLRDVLAGFFAAHVLPPGLYVPREAFDGDLELAEPYATQAWQQGAGLVELARALQTSTHLQALRPQA